MEDKIGRRVNAVVMTFLSRFCPDDLLEEIEGDLLQRFERDVKRFGLRRARRRFVWNAIRFFRPGIVMRNRVSFGNNTLYSFRIFLKYSSGAA